MRDGAINPNLTPTQRAKALHDQQTADARARQFGLTDALQLHRPGFRRNTDATSHARVQQAYAAADAADANAWRADAKTTIATNTNPNTNTTAAFDAKQAAYDEYDREQANAWRTRR